MKCVQVVLNAFTHDSRVLRECGTLASNGYRVVVFALHEELLPEREEMAFGTVRRFRLRTRGWSRRPVVQVLKYVECALRMVCRGVAERPRVVQAHDLEALPIGFLIARLARARLVYDSHELWEDVTSVREYPPLLLRLLLFLERFLARRADAVITVSEGIARRMARQMQIRQPAVVRNVPWSRSRTTRTSQPLRDALKLDPSIPIILYQGKVGTDYGVDILIDAMQHVVAPAVAVLLGNGQSVEDMQERAARQGLARRVLFHKAVPPELVLDFTADGTIGVSPIRDLSLSYRYCLPNKLFEYVQSGLPVVISDLPEMTALVERYQVGCTFQCGDAKSLAGALNRMLNDPAALERYRAAIRMASDDLRWEREQAKLLEVYGRLVGDA
jgi:glycosyltransferase involved in cell wall biosynthesis